MLSCILYCACLRQNDVILTYFTVVGLEEKQNKTTITTTTTPTTQFQGYDISLICLWRLFLTLLIDSYPFSKSCHTSFDTKKETIRVVLSL